MKYYDSDLEEEFEIADVKEQIQKIERNVFYDEDFLNLFGTVINRLEIISKKEEVPLDIDELNNVHQGLSNLLENLAFSNVKDSLNMIEWEYMP